jgi:FHA domain-containing protein
MTKKRDLKRRVRERQAKTGESYVTARRRVVAAAARAPVTEPATEPEPALEPATELATEPATEPATEHAIEHATEHATELAPGRATEHATGHAREPATEPATGPATEHATAPQVERAPAPATVPEPETQPTQQAVDERDDVAGPSGSTIPYVELVDVSAEAEGVGFRCRVMVTPQLADGVMAAALLERLHHILHATPGDPTTKVMRAAALEGVQPKRSERLTTLEPLRRFLQRARVGLGGLSDDGMHLAFQVAGTDHASLVSVLCTVMPAKGPTLVMSVVGEDLSHLWAFSRAEQALLGPTLFLIFESKRYAILDDRFVIGRERSSDLQIRDGHISRQHAAVIRRNGTFYIKDLGSTGGIHYKGMRIDNKRIDEADVFQIGRYELRFTFVADD